MTENIATVTTLSIPGLYWLDVISGPVGFVVLVLSGIYTSMKIYDWISSKRSK